MRKSEAVKMPEVSPCHAVQGEIELEGIEFLPSLFDGKLNHSSTEEIFKVGFTPFTSEGDSLKLCMELITRPRGHFIICTMVCCSIHVVFRVFNSSQGQTSRRLSRQRTTL